MNADSIIWLAVLGYFLLGIAAIAILELATRRVSTRLWDAAYEARDRLAAIWIVVSPRAALVIIILAVWVLWPSLIYAAVVPSHKKEGGKREDNGAS